MAEGSDDDLMLRYRRGDTAAFNVLYARHKDATYRYCRRQLSSGLADDAHQETWLALVKSRDKYDPQGRFKSWLFTLAHNVLLNRVRTEAKHPPAAREHDVLSLVANPEEASDRQQLRAQLLQHIRELPHPQRDALVLQHEGGFSIEDIAIITSTTREGVRSRLRYAMRKLRAGMQPNQMGS